jgi:hypothetical protein
MSSDKSDDEFSELLIKFKSLYNIISSDSWIEANKSISSLLLSDHFLSLSLDPLI